jgi:hypothetical protein
MLLSQGCIGAVHQHAGAGGGADGGAGGVV